MVKKLVSSLCEKEKKLVSSLCEKEKKRQQQYESRNDEQFVGNEYERVRARRIKENMEKMRDLGLKVYHNPTTRIILSNKEPFVKTINKKQPTAVSHHLQPSMPRRTSSRLTKKPLMMMMNEAPIRGDKIFRDKGKVKSEEEEEEEEENHGEVYTNEHEKLLGDCKTPWPMFDAHDSSSSSNCKRLYDSVNGTTCHQCRQKTLRLHTSCNLCHLPHGRLCGNCLYIRYGENLLEAKENGSWTCLVCRGICNCSRCREQKGWPPTGPIHNEAWKLGFKSVAHYLIHTRRAK